MKKKLLSLGLVLSMVAAMAVGCGNNGGGSALQSATEAKTYADFTGDDKDITLTWWIMGGTEEYYQTYWSEMKSFQQLQANMGVKIEFKVATSYESYLPMMSAQNYPHIITAKNMERYPGRMGAMYDEDVSVDMTPYMEEGLMPNFSKIVEEYPQMARDLKLDTGEYTFLSTLYDIEDEEDRVASSLYGPAIRQDWLDVVGMEVPTDMSEWYDVLKAFKTQDPNGNGEADEEPLCLASSGWKYFLPAYGIDDDPSIMDIDGKKTVVHGYQTPEYKAYLTEMNKWHQEGLISNMFRQTSLEALAQQVNGNLAGAWKGSYADFDQDDPTSAINVLRDSNPEAEIVAAPWPKTEDGYHWCFSDINSYHRDTTVITNNAVKDGVDKAAAYVLDYMLSEEGSMLMTWGIEGESYEVVDGEIKLVDGMDESVDFAGAKIKKMDTYADPLTIAFPSFGQISDFSIAQKGDDYVEASRVWAQGDTSYKMQSCIQLTVQQETENNDLIDNMKTYMSKMRARFVEGKEPLTNYDRYVEQVDLLGGETYQQLWQQAYDNYLAR